MLTVQVDSRLGGKPKYFIAEEGARQLIVPDEMRKCAVFLCYARGNEIKYEGTGFFLATEVVAPDLLDGYLVTAAHVINGIAARSADGKVLIRVNMLNGGTEFFNSNVSQWITYPDEVIDAAVLPFTPPTGTVDYLAYPASACATDEVIARNGIGVGDEVFLTGLFINHYGTQRNLPIVRVGNIALMPEEKVSTRFGDIDAYLIEARSIGGLSGSPVFVNLGTHRFLEGQLQQATSPAIFFLLGLMQGHWDLTEDEIDLVRKDDNTVVQSVNMGIGIVVTASDILKLLDLPELVERREEMKRRHKRNKFAGG